MDLGLYAAAGSAAWPAWPVWSVADRVADHHRVAGTMPEQGERATSCIASWQVLGTPKAQVGYGICTAQTAPISVAHERRVIDPLLLRHPKCSGATKAITD